MYTQALSYYDAGDKLRLFNRYGVGPVYEEYRYDAFGRRVVVRSRVTDGCGPPVANCGSTERTVWDGAQVLYEIRAIGDDSAGGGFMESDDAIGSGMTYGQLGRVGYTHAGGMDRPVTVFRIKLGSGQPDLLPLVPHTDWRGTAAVGHWMNGTATTGACPPFPAGRTTVEIGRASCRERVFRTV